MDNRKPALSSLLRRLKYIGEGSFSRVYAYGSDHVIKIPYDEITGQIRPCEQRIRQAKFIVGWTQILRDRIGEVITPVTYHIGGAVIQRKLTSKAYHDLSPTVRFRTVKQVDDLIILAEKICRDLVDSISVVDTNESNFRYDDDGNVVEWFDPVAPSDSIFSAKDVFTNSDNNVR